MKVQCYAGLGLTMFPLGRFFRAGDLIGLRPLLSLDDIEFDLVTFFQTFIAVKLDCAVMNENIRSIIAADKSIAFCVVEPLHFSFVCSHEP